MHCPDCYLIVVLSHKVEAFPGQHFYAICFLFCWLKGGMNNNILVNVV